MKTFLGILLLCSSLAFAADGDKRKPHFTGQFQVSQGYAPAPTDPIDPRLDFPFFDARIVPLRCGSEEGRAGITNPRFVRGCIGRDRTTGVSVMMIRDGVADLRYYRLYQDDHMIRAGGLEKTNVIE